MSLYCEAFMPDQGLKETEFVRVLTNIAGKLTLKIHDQAPGTEPDIDLRFLLPAGDDVPLFSGMRLHSYDRRAQRLLIESAVPERLLNSKHCSAYIVAVMQDAIDNANDFFNEQQVGFNSSRQHNLVEGLVAA